MAVKNQTKGHQLCCVATPKIEVTREELYFSRQKCVDDDDHVCENTCTSRCNAASEEEEAKSAIFIAFCAARATCN